MLRLAGEVVSGAEGSERLDQQPVGIELASELDRLFAEPPCCRGVNEESGEGGGDQRCPEQLWIRPGFGPVQRGQQQREGFLVAVARPPVAFQRHAEAQQLCDPVRCAGCVLSGAPQVRLIGVRPREPPALVRPGQMRGRRPATDR